MHVKPRRSKKTGKPTAFRAVWHDINGKEQSAGFATEREAKLHAAEMYRLVEGQGIGDPDKMSCAQWFDKWLATRRESGLSPSTIPSEVNNLKKFRPLIGGKPVATTSTGDVEDAMLAILKGGGKNGKPIAASSLRTARAILNNCFKAARKRKLRADNPVTDAVTPGKVAKRKPRPWTADEATRLLAAAAEEGCEAEAMLFCGSGIRRAELLGLRKSRIDWAANKITIDATVVPGEKGEAVFQEHTKTDKSARTISVPPEALAAVRRHVAAQAEHILQWGSEYHRLDLVFADLDGQPLRPQTMSTRLRKLMAKAGIAKGKQPAHAWRHLHLSTLIRNKVDLVTVKLRAGHSEVTTTLNFYGASDDEADAAAAAAFGDIMAGFKPK